jgi:hypothetical protein
MPEKLTIKEVLAEIKEVVETRQSQVKSPEWWLDRAFMLNGLLPDLNDNLIKEEMNYNQEVASAVEDLDMSVAQAERKVKSTSETYRMYQYLKARKKVVEEMIMLSKKKYKE